MIRKLLVESSTVDIKACSVWVLVFKNMSQHHSNYKYCDVLMAFDASNNNVSQAKTRLNAIRFPMRRLSNANTFRRPADKNLSSNASEYYYVEMLAVTVQTFDKETIFQEIAAR